VPDLIRIDSLDVGQVAATIPGAPALDHMALARDRPQESWVLRRSSGTAVAHASLWWRETPSLDGRRTGLVGHYAAIDDIAAHRILDHACRRLAAEGCETAVGPMDGSTWRRYRLVVERGTEPPYFMEVDTPDEWADHFRSAGFSVTAEYLSTLVEDLAPQDPRVARVVRRLDQLGVAVRPLDRTHLDDDVRAIHALSLEAFRHAVLYSPISQEEFMSLYAPVLPRVDPRLVLLAEHGDRLAGYVFGVPDLNEAARGAAVQTLIVKTLAVHPDRAYAGLGAVLLSRVHESAAGMGLHRVIHALMHVSNQSRALSAHWRARPIRRYALFARTLSP